MNRFGLRIGAVFGWIAFLGVTIGLVVLPMAIAGQPPTLHSAAVDVRTYFGHQELAVVNALSPLIAIALIPFALALRNALRDGDDTARFAADVGILAVIVAAPLYVISSSLGVALAGLATGDANAFDASFRLYSVLYDGGADFLEGAWVGAFALAMLGAPEGRWLGGLGVAVALSRWVKATAPVVALPDALALVGGIAFLVWFAWTVVWLTRRSMDASVAHVAVSSPAAV